MFNFIFCDLGDQPIGPSVGGDGSNGADRYLRMRALPSTVAASYDAQSIVEVTVFDDNRNPISGKPVTFSTSRGIIAAADTTDTNGLARVVFTSESSSGNAVITARIKMEGEYFIITDTIRIRGSVSEIDSVTNNMRIHAIPASIAASYSDHSIIEVTVYDDNHNPVINSEILFAATRGVITALGITDSNGVASATFSGEPGGGDATVSARMILDDSVMVVATTVKLIGTSMAVDSADKNMRIRAFPSNLLASYDETAEIEVAIYDDNHNPISGKEITFSTDAGTITRKSETGDDGIAAALFTSEPLNADVPITATMSAGDSSISVTTTITLRGIEVMVIPQLSSAPLRTTVPVTIRLLDGKGEPMPDRLITISDDSAKTTNGAGEVTTTVRRTAAGSVTVSAEALGAADSATVFFGNTPPVDNDNTIRSIRLFTSHSQLRADNSAEATVTAIIISGDNHNPLIGETVQFSSTLGIIDQYGVTDSTGRTTVTLRSAPINGECMIHGVLQSNSALKDSTTILFSGVTLELSVDREDLPINDTAVVQALLKDGSGNPISSDQVIFSVETPAIFNDDRNLMQSSLNATGIAKVEVTSATAKTVLVHAASANVSDSITINFSTNNLTVSSSEASVIIGGDDSTKIIALYLDRSEHPIGGKTITFATNAGTLTGYTAVTNTKGRAETWLKSGYFSTEATVQAKADDGSAYTTVFFRASEPGKIVLAVTPDNIGVNGGIAEMIATVRDDSGNVVTGAEVSFRILKGPGGGEKITKPIIVSTNEGVARAQLEAGSLPSTYRGCEVEASVNGIRARSKLTISGEPHTISISRPEDDTVKVPNGGIMDESTFEFYIGAVVNDVNGNPVADGTPVNFSAVVSGLQIATLAFDRWAGVESTDEIKPVYRWEYRDIPFEDVNGNFQMDHGIDLELDGNDNVARRGDDVNGDGNMDYNIAEHDFSWLFSGSEPYWPASKEYITITDRNDSRFREPDTSITERIEMRITATIASDSSSVTYDTNYVQVFDTSIVYPAFDSTYTIFADLNQNGIWDRSPLAVDHDGDGEYDGPLSRDFEFWRWEMRKQFKGDRLDFSDNDVAMVIDRTAVTKDGVAYTRLTYPRQMAARIIATVNAEVKGRRDKDGERFVLPVIR